MISLLVSNQKQRTAWLRTLVFMMTMTIALLGWIVSPHSTAKFQTVLEHNSNRPSINLQHDSGAFLPEPAPAALPRPRMSRSSTNAFAPFLNIVPDGDGTQLFIQARDSGDVAGTLFANVGIGGGGNKGSYTMVYSGTMQAYVATAVGFSPNFSQSGSLNITTTAGLATKTVNFSRSYIPASSLQTIASSDNVLQLSLVNAETLSFDTYVAIVPSLAPPGPAPDGYNFVGSVYSVRASNALTATQKPMILQMHYDSAALNGVDPQALAVFAWDAFNQHWQNLGGRLFATQMYFSVPTSRFTTYALMSMPPHLQFDRTDVAFEPQIVGTNSMSQTVLLTNTGSSVASTLEIQLHGDFSYATTCDSTLAADESCSISLTFTPTAAGERTGNLIVAFDTTSNPLQVGLYGTGTPATVMRQVFLPSVYK